MSGRKKNIGIIVFFVGFTLFLFRQYIVFHQVPINGNLLISFYQPWASYRWDGYTVGPPAKPIGFDDLRMFFPLRSLVSEAWGKGHIPLWNPYSFSGNVTLGTYQSAVFFPLTFLFFFLPEVDAWTIIMIVAPLLTALFMYIFLRDIGISRKGSIFGTLVFSFCGMMIVWLEEMFMSVYSFLPLPLALFAINRMFTSKRVYPFYLLVFSFVFSIISGYFQTTFYMSLIVIAWTLFLSLRHREKAFVPFCMIIGAGIISALLCGIQLFPSYEAYHWSARGSTDVKGMFIQFFAPLGHLITFLAPDYFGNPATHNYYGTSFYHEKVIWFTIPGLFFALLAGVTARKRDVVSLFFLVAGIIFLSLAFSLPTSWFLLYQLHLPFISEMTPSRIVYVSSFCFSVLSAIGIDHFLKKPRWKPLIVILFFLVIALISAWIPAIKQYSGIKLDDKVPLRNLIFPTMVFVVFAGTIGMGFIKRLQRVSYVCILGLVLVSVAYFFSKYYSFSKRDYVYPTTPVITKLQELSGIDRFTSIGNAYIDRNFAQYFRLYSPEGYESFNVERYNQFVMSSHTKGLLPTLLNRADASLYPAKNLSELGENTYTLKVMSLLGVRFIITPHVSVNAAPISGNLFTRIWTDGTFDIYQYNQSLPRYFLVSSYVVITSPQKILDYIYVPDHDMSQTVVLEQDPHQTFLPLNTSDQVVLRSYESEKIIFQAKVTHNALLFLSDNHYPGWLVRVDGKKVPLYRADYSFRAVVIPSGAHEVIFSFEPTTVEWGYYSLIGGLVSLLCVSMIFRYFKRRV